MRVYLPFVFCFSESMDVFDVGLLPISSGKGWRWMGRVQRITSF